MIYVLLFLCIYCTFYYIGNLVMMVTNFVKGNKEVAHNQNGINTILEMICATLWTLFIWLWN